MQPAIRSHGGQQPQARIQYGAWDDPGVSIFAVVAQEPLSNMLSMMKPLPIGSSDFDKEAYPLIQKSSAAENAVFRTVKFQVEQLALNRRMHMRPKEEQQRIDTELIRALVKERKGEIVAESRRVQLQRNVPELRDLQVEVNGAKTALSVRQHMQAELKAKSVGKQTEREEALAQQKQLEVQLLKEQLVADQKALAFREALMTQIAEAAKNRLRTQHETEVAERRELLELQEQYALEQRQDAEKFALKRKQLQESLKKTAEQKQAARAAEEKANVVRPQRGILDSFGPKTAAFVAKDMKRRADEIQAREINSARLGFQLSQIRHDRETRDDLFIDLLEREYNAKETKKALEKIHMQQAANYANRDQVSMQRKEDKYFREQWASTGNDIVPDATSFGERQYRLYDDRTATMYKKNMQSHHEMLQLAMANEHGRNAEAEAARNLTAALAQLQEAQDVAVGEERLRLLRSQPQEVLNAMKPFTFTANEQKVLNLETSKKI